MTASPRRGRRPGAPDTRAAILAAAQARFAEHGFARTSVRSVAADAGVDAALVHHYFGSKDDLFVAALELPVDPRERLASVVAGGVDGAGERMVTAFLSVWDDPELRLPLIGLARSILDPSGQRLLREGFVSTVLHPVGVGLGIDRPETRMPLVASQMVGLILTRYVLEVEPIASMPAADVIAIYGPTIQRYLTAPLP